MSCICQMWFPSKSKIFFHPLMEERNKQFPLTVSKTKWWRSLSGGPCIGLYLCIWFPWERTCAPVWSLPLRAAPQASGGECRRVLGFGGGVLRCTPQRPNRQRIEEFRRNNGQLWEIVLFRCSALGHSELNERRSELAFLEGRPQARLLKLPLSQTHCLSVPRRQCPALFFFFFFPPSPALILSVFFLSVCLYCACVFIRAFSLCLGILRAWHHFVLWWDV